MGAVHIEETSGGQLHCLLLHMSLVHAGQWLEQLKLLSAIEGYHLQENAAMNAAIEKHEGCNIYGWLEVQRVAGNFHLSVHADHYFAMRSVGAS